MKSFQKTIWSHNHTPLNTRGNNVTPTEDNDERKFGFARALSVVVIAGEDVVFVVSVRYIFVVICCLGKKNR